MCENLTEKVVILDRFGLNVYLAYCYFTINVSLLGLDRIFDITHAFPNFALIQSTPYRKAQNEKKKKNHLLAIVYFYDHVRRNTQFIYFIYIYFLLI